MYLICLIMHLDTVKFPQYIYTYCCIQCLIKVKVHTVFCQYNIFPSRYLFFFPENSLTEKLSELLCYMIYTYHIF